MSEKWVLQIFLWLEGGLLVCSFVQSLHFLFEEELEEKALTRRGKVGKVALIIVCLDFTVQLN